MAALLIGLPFTDCIGRVKLFSYCSGIKKNKNKIKRQKRKHAHNKSRTIAATKGISASAALGQLVKYGIAFARETKSCKKKRRKEQRRLFSPSKPSLKYVVLAKVAGGTERNVQSAST